jgi:hypothetical protein
MHRGWAGEAVVGDIEEEERGGGNEAKRDLELAGAG